MGDEMVFLLVIGCPLVALLVIAFFTDRKSKRVRGHVGRVRTRTGVRPLPGQNALAGEKIAMFGPGSSAPNHLHVTDQPPTDG
jgi:hypothetical protein